MAPTTAMLSDTHAKVNVRLATRLVMARSHHTHTPDFHHAYSLHVEGRLAAYRILCMRISFFKQCSSETVRACRERRTAHWAVCRSHGHGPKYVCKCHHSNQRLDDNDPVLLFVIDTICYFQSITKLAH